MHSYTNHSGQSLEHQTSCTKIRNSLPKKGFTLVFAAILGMSGCTSSIAQNDAAANLDPKAMLGSAAGYLPATFAPSEPPIDTKKVPHLKVQQHSSADTRCKIAVSWAQIYGLDNFNDLLQKWSEPLLNSCPEGTTQLSVRSTWEIVAASGNLFAQRLTVSQNTSKTPGLRSATFYTFLGKEEQSFTSSELISDQAKPRLVDSVANLLYSNSSTAKINHSELVNKVNLNLLLLEDISLDTKGNLLVRVPLDLLPENTKNTVVRIEAKDALPLLSKRGEEVAKEILDNKDFIGLPQEPAAPSPPPKPSVPPVDCNAVPCVALTFDDGPGPYTNHLLDILDQSQVKATFFLVGRSIAGWADVVKRQYNSGHAVGSHTWSHPVLSKLTPEQVDQELLGTTQAITQLTGSAVTFMRPPYGATNPMVMERLRNQGLAAIHWNVDTEDWRNKNSDIVTQRALAGARPGAIILMHDIHPTTVEAVPRIIAGLREKGFHLATIPEVLSSTPLEAGKQYFARGQVR